MKSTLTLLFIAISIIAVGQKKDSRYFEMRTYHCNDNKRPDLIKRFQDHTLRLLEKHGITNIGYFIPTDSNNNSLTFILAYPDQASRDVRWNNFANDPQWKEAHKNSEANGPLVAKVDQVFMTLAPDLTPKIKKSGSTEWIKVKDASEANGKIVEKVVSVYLQPLAFSKMK